MVPKHHGYPLNFCVETCNFSGGDSGVPRYNKSTLSAHQVRVLEGGRGLSWTQSSHRPTMAF